MKYLIPMIFLFSSCNVLKNVIGDGESPDQNFFGKHCDVDGPDVDGNGTADNCEFQNDNTTIDDTVYSLGDGIVSFWRFEETGGTAGRSDSFGTNHFDYNSGTIFAGSGVIGSSLECANFGLGYVNRSVSTGMDLGATEDFTFAAWVRTDSNHLGYIFEKYNDIQIHTWDSGAANHTDINVWLFGGNFTMNTAYEPLSYGGWHHVVVRVDRDSEVSIIVDANFSNETQLPTDLTGFGFTGSSEIHPCYFESAGPSSIFDGGVDSMGFWNRLLTDEEITALYNGNNNID